MSESTSFLGGAAIAGLVAVVLLRGGVSANNSPSATPMASPTPSTLPSPIATALPLPAQTIYDYQQQSQAQKQALERLQTAVQQQNAETNKLKEYIQRQQMEVELLKNQAKIAAAPPATPVPNKVGASDPDQPMNPLAQGLIWAVGGIVLCFGGGLFLITMFAWFVRQQQRNSRTHTEYYTTRPAYRLPPSSEIPVPHYPAARVSVRRTRHIVEDDDY